MASSIAGQAGGASASGALVYLVPTSGAAPSRATINAAVSADGSFIFNGLAAGTYRLAAGGNFTVGPYKGFTYKQTKDITVDGVTAYTGVDIPNPTAP
jgi:hypothetical protein